MVRFVRQWSKRRSMLRKKLCCCGRRRYEQVDPPDLASPGSKVPLPKQHLSRPASLLDEEEPVDDDDNDAAAAARPDHVTLHIELLARDPARRDVTLTAAQLQPLAGVLGQVHFKIDRTSGIVHNQRTGVISVTGVMSPKTAEKWANRANQSYLSMCMGNYYDVVGVIEVPCDL